MGERAGERWCSKNYQLSWAGASGSGFETGCNVLSGLSPGVFTSEAAAAGPGDGSGLEVSPVCSERTTSISSRNGPAAGKPIASSGSTPGSPGRCTPPPTGSPPARTTPKMSLPLPRTVIFLHHVLDFSLTDHLSSKISRGSSRFVNRCSTLLTAFSSSKIDTSGFTATRSSSTQACIGRRAKRVFSTRLQQPVIAPPHP